MQLPTTVADAELPMAVLSSAQYSAVESAWLSALPLQALRRTGYALPDGRARLFRKTQGRGPRTSHPRPERTRENKSDHHG